MSYSAKAGGAFLVPKDEVGGGTARPERWKTTKVTQAQARRSRYLGEMVTVPWKKSFAVAAVFLDSVADRAFAQYVP